MNHFLEDKVIWETIGGIPFPVIPSSKSTVRSPEGFKVRTHMPIYITQLKRNIEKESDAALKAGILSCYKEIALAVNRGKSLSLEGQEAPLAVSASIPYDSVWIDHVGQRLVLNETFALEHYWDADGDRATLHFGKKFEVDEEYCERFGGIDPLTQEHIAPGSEVDHTGFGVLIKFPVTSPPPILKILQGTQVPLESFQDFGFKEAESLLAEAKPLPDAEELLNKSVNIANTGIVTSAWNTKDLFDTTELPWWQRLCHFYTDPNRPKDIEDNGLKVIRKDGKEAQELAIAEFMAQISLEDAWKPALTSTGSIGSMDESRLAFFEDTNLEAYTQAVLDLNVTFRERKEGFVNENKYHTLVDGFLIENLESMGLIRFAEFNAQPGLPPACIMYLSLPNGTPTGCADVKREASSETGLTYAYVVYPVYDNLDVYGEKNGTFQVVWPASKTFVHPKVMMSKILSSFDSTIRWNGEVKGYWCDARARGVRYALAQFQDPKWATRVSMLEKAIRDYAGIYGDPIPAEFANGTVTPTIMAKAIATRTVVVDAGKVCTPVEMAVTLLEANKVHPINFCGTKSTNMRVRKVPLANSEGGAAWAPLGIHLARPGKSRSQLLRSAMIPKMTIAIVRGATIGGVEITPSGIKKQTTETCFLPQVFDTIEDFENHCKGFGLDPKEEQCLTKEAPAWTGETRIYYSSSPKSQIRIGKLIDALGNKFMPRRYDQAVVTPKYGETGEVVDLGKPIDLLIPADELIAKGCLQHFLGKAEEREIEVDGKFFTALVCEHQFFRTQTASEAIPARKRKASYDGMDMFPIYRKLYELSKVNFVNPNLGFAICLQNSLRKLLGKESLYDFTVPQKQASVD